jgi:hypothetical protein
MAHGRHSVFVPEQQPEPAGNPLAKPPSGRESSATRQSSPRSSAPPSRATSNLTSHGSRGTQQTATPPAPHVHIDFNVHIPTVLSPPQEEPVDQTASVPTLVIG